jgi:ketosteroid isomerase-like protein
MKGVISRERCLLLVAVLLFVTAHRLPAPIQEVPENPTPTLEQSAKRKQKSEQDTSPHREQAVMSSSDKSSISATISKLENKWEASVISHDSSVANSLLADDYVGVSSKGKVLSKAMLLNEIKSDTDVYDSAVNETLDVRVANAALAIATGLAHEKGKSKDGKSFDRSFRFTDTWTKRNGQWRCTASQAVRVSQR